MIANIDKTTAKGPHTGASTHHHDHDITLNNFNVIKHKARIIQKNEKLLVVVF